MACLSCRSERIASINGKTSDCCWVGLSDGGRGQDGYVPSDMGIGGGDYIEFNWCLNCGKIHREFPIAQCQLEIPEGHEDS